MDYTLIRNVVNRALEQMAAREMASGGQLSAEQKIADQVVSDLFPTLAEKFGQMLLINERWVANAVGDKIVAAASQGQRLAGYEPAAWAVWGQLLPHVMAFLELPFEVTLPDGTVSQMTLKNAVMTDYLKEGDA
jgi:serine phosphatase RsbU (regulator of sigma subunit)